MMGLGKLFYVILLLVNSVAILSEDRFLNRIGWGSNNNSQYGVSPGDSSVKSRMINLISATRTLLRLPLILINILVIVYEIILG